MKQALIIAAIFLVLFGPSFAWKNYKYRQCRGVGYSVIYCVFRG